MFFQKHFCEHVYGVWFISQSSITLQSNLHCSFSFFLNPKLIIQTLRSLQRDLQIDCTEQKVTYKNYNMVLKCNTLSLYRKVWRHTLSVISLYRKAWRHTVSCVHSLIVPLSISTTCYAKNRMLIVVEIIDATIIW